jgi:hypothetical protein
MSEIHTVKDIQLNDSTLSLRIDGKVHAFNLGDISNLLPGASQEERSNFKISPSGYGIHWPLIDEDISVDGLLGIAHSPSSERKSA